MTQTKKINRNIKKSNFKNNNIKNDKPSNNHNNDEPQLKEENLKSQAQKRNWITFGTIGVMSLMWGIIYWVFIAH